MAMRDGPAADLDVEPVNLTMVTFNRLEFTLRSIESIAATAGYPYVLTVVDNASRDGTIDALQGLRDRGIIHRLMLNPENKGVAFAANQGWNEGGKAHYLKVDNDIVFTKVDWLARLVDACDALPWLGAIAYNFETTTYPVRVVNGLTIRTKAGNVGGACVMIPERVHRLVGFWCEDYWPYGEEDFDMYLRLRQLDLASVYMDDEDVGLHLPEGKAGPLTGVAAASLFDEGDPEYRAQKDRWRAIHTGPRGLRRINATLYRTRLRPVYVEHDVPYRPSVLARIFVAARFRRLGSWEHPSADATS